MKKKLSILLLLFFTHLFWGQIKGLYLKSENGNTPVSGATITNENGTFTQVSNELGLISLSALPESSERISINKIGFEQLDLSISNLKTTNQTFLAITLIPKISSIAEVSLSGVSQKGPFKVLNDLDIHLRPINNSQEVLRMIPGVFIGQHAGGGKAEQIFLRGFDLDHGTDINISVDGIPVNMVSHAHGQGYADLHFIIPELIHQVDFNKGPYFANKGNFTTAGYVDFKLKDFLDRNFLKLETGQFNTYRGVFGFNLLNTKNVQKRNKSLYFSGEAFFTKGYFDNPQDFNRINGLLKYFGQVNEQTTISAFASAFSSKWNASGQIPDRAVEDGTVGFYGAIDPNEGGKTSRYNFNVETISQLNNGGQIKNQIFYSKYLFELFSNFTFFKNDPINGDQIKQKENRDLMGFNSTYQKTYQIGNFKTESALGLQTRYDIMNGSELSRTLNRNTTLLPITYCDIKEFNAGVFVSQKTAVTPKLYITSAIRFDHLNQNFQNILENKNASSSSSIWSPKLNFDYHLNNKIHLYWYNGRGFHSNDTRVVLSENSRKALPPAYGTDIGSVFKIGNSVVLQTAVWYLWLDQEFIYVGDEGVVETSGKTQRMGVDLSARLEISKNLFIDTDISLAKPKAIGVPKEENHLPLAPVFTSTGGLTYKNTLGWNGSFRYRYMADRPANETNTTIAEGYFIMDGALNYTHKNWEIGISVQNVFNTKWKETQFETESQLKNEPSPVSEIHFTPGVPFFAKLNFTLFL